MGFKNRTDDPADAIVADLVSGNVPGVLILDPDKVGEVAVKVVQKVAPIRKHFHVLPSFEELQNLAKTCRHCNLCRRSCPQDLQISEAMTAAAEGNISKLADLYEICIGCGRCEQACPVKLQIHSYILKAG
jgi:acetyl-CoA decarbonylase/synthase complex subunit alpha